MEGYFLIFLVLVGLCYVYFLRGKIAHDQTKISTHLKEVIALLHRRADHVSLVQPNLVKLMPDETVMLQELADAQSTLLQVLRTYDVSQIATANAELNRCLFDMRERMQVYPDCLDSEAMIRFEDDFKQLDKAITEHIETYNKAVEQFERKVNRPPVMFFRFLVTMEALSYFIHEQATVTDHHLEAVVLE